MALCLGIAGELGKSRSSRLLPYLEGIINAQAVKAQVAHCWSGPASLVLR